MKRAVIGLVFLVACGGNGGWSHSQKAEFMAGCTDAAPEDFTDEQLAQLTDLCECSAEKAEEEGIDDPEEITEAKASQFVQECSE
ncbi:MAG: hypothetical protein ACRDJI_09800 [Actinomycetota bacterium]